MNTQEYKVPFNAGVRTYIYDHITGVLKIKITLDDNSAVGTFLKGLYTLLCDGDSPEWTIRIETLPPTQPDELCKGLEQMVGGAYVQDAFPDLNADQRGSLLDPPSLHL
jgi:hypothetical protein